MNTFHQQRKWLLHSIQDEDRWLTFDDDDDDYFKSNFLKCFLLHLISFYMDRKEDCFSLIFSNFHLIFFVADWLIDELVCLVLFFLDQQNKTNNSEIMDNSCRLFVAWNETKIDDD